MRRNAVVKLDISGFVCCALAVLACAAGAIFPTAAAADEYPSRTVRIIVPFPPGGTADVMPRIVADWLSRKWGQPVIIENKTGAAGNIGAEAAYNATPDGYTLLSAPPPPLVINQNLYPKLAFDPTRFVPISTSNTVSAPLPLIPSTPIPTLVKSSANWPSPTVRSTKSRIHCGESFMIEPLAVSS